MTSRQDTVFVEIRVGLVIRLSSSKVSSLVKVVLSTDGGLYALMRTKYL